MFLYFDMLFLDMAALLFTQIPGVMSAKPSETAVTGWLQTRTEFHMFR